ncbi:hypothetical protein [Streptomyces sp. NPDC058280]|uniref:hypothetical protein n=1 Tax=Streptomyces sp. NPDC058280 TaxID=3346419 RepID=UPI0036EC2EA9
MIILTGPQSAADQRGNLAEMAGLIDARLTCSTDVVWADVTALYYMDGWEDCPLAMADVDVATLMGLPVLPAPARPPLVD